MRSCHVLNIFYAVLCLCFSRLYGFYRVSSVLKMGSSKKANSGTVADLEVLSVQQALTEIIGSNTYKGKLYPRVELVRSAPTVCQYVLANPIAFFRSPRLAATFGIHTDTIKKTTPLQELARILPVIYIADSHSDYGTLGFQLNNKMQDTTMVDLHPELRSLRQRPVYQGGPKFSGSSFTMIHRKVGFPENR